MGAMGDAEPLCHLKMRKAPLSPYQQTRRSAHLKRASLARVAASCHHPDEGEGACHIQIALNFTILKLPAPRLQQRLAGMMNTYHICVCKQTYDLTHHRHKNAMSYWMPQCHSIHNC